MYKTAESVTPMHPDKVCDRISDAILDECLKQDPKSRCAIETMGGHNIISVTGEMTTDAFVDINEVVKEIVGKKYGVQVNIVKQSHCIAHGVDMGGAGDQGIMVGYACNENPEMIPQELYLARSLCKYIYQIHKEDGKTQITIDDDNEIKTIVASFCNVPSPFLLNIINEWINHVYVQNHIMVHEPKIFCNPAGDWNIGGFDADTGLTGRKLAVDNYGPRVPIGGGAFSGKDATKVDRSGAYIARRIAVDLLREYKAREVTVKIAYSIGIASPVMITAIVDNEEMDVSKYYDLSPREIINKLELTNPIFQKTAEWGAFGNGFNWDK